MSAVAAAEVELKEAIKYQFKLKRRQKATNECLFCGSRFCYNRIVARDGSYDEVSCYKHVSDMADHSDLAAPKIRKRFITSSARQKRGTKAKKEAHVHN